MVQESFQMAACIISESSLLSEDSLRLGEDKHFYKSLRRQS